MGVRLPATIRDAGTWSRRFAATTATSAFLSGGIESPRVRSGQRPSAAGKLLDVEFTEQGVRTGLERCLRTSAREAEDMWTRFVLVDQANAVRPRTML